MDNLISSTKAATGRLGLQMAGIFVVGFLALVVLLFVWDLFTSFSNPGDVGPSSAITAIDPKLEGELRTAIDFEGFKVPSDVKNPFTDRGGLTEVANAQGVTPPAGQVAAGQPGTPSASGASTGQKPEEVKPPDPVAETKARYEDRQRKLRSGIAVGPEAEVFSVEDLLPVGSVSGGAGSDEVIFYSRALNRTVSFALKTRLFDGWISEVKKEGVVFVMDGKVRVSRMKPWESSLKQSLSALPIRKTDMPNLAGDVRGLGIYA